LIIPGNAYLFFKIINDFIGMRAKFLENWIQTITEKIGMDDS
jgi:hypothetical protein